MANSGRVSCAGWYCLCFLSLAYTVQLRMFLPEYGYDPASYMISTVITLVCSFIAAIPGFLLASKQPRILAAEGGCAPLRIAYGVILLFYAAYAAAHFSLFLHLTLYPATPRWLTCVLLALTALAVILNGLPQLVRISIFAASFFVLVFIIMCLLFVGEFDISLIDPPRGNLITPARLQLFSMSELALLPFGALCCDIERKKPFTVFVVAGAVTGILSNLLIVSPLGAGADNFIYPFFSGLQVTGSTFLQRPDILYLTVWSVLAVIRTALYLLVSCELLTPAKYRAKVGAKLIITAVMLAAAIATVSDYDGILALRRLLYGGLGFIPAVIILPLIGLIVAARRKKCEKR